MPPLPRVSAILLQLQAIEEPGITWSKELSAEQRLMVCQASHQLAGRAGEILQTWSRDGACPETEIEALEEQTSSLLGALDELPANHRAQRNINLSKVMLRINS